MRGDEGEEGIKRSEKWLEDMRSGLGRELESLCLDGLRIRVVQKGFVRCSFVIPHNLTDKDGNWEAGAVAVLIDDVAACAVGSYSQHLFVKASLDFHISFYSSAKAEQEVEVEGKIVGDKGRLISVVVELKKKKENGDGEMIAVGRVWFATDTINRYPQHLHPTVTTTTSSKL